MLEELRAGLSADALIDDPDRMDSYRFDSASFCDAGTPVFVVRPKSTAEVQHVLRVAAEHGVPVVPQGARTGLSGGANAIDGCIVLSLERMNRILEIDPVNRTAVVEPGVVNAVLSRAVLEVGLFYPPDPSSWEQSTIGGNIATNAGGLCCVKYGVTADFVRGLEVVLASGDVLETGRRTAKGVAGYDLTRLFVGSEGTLGVVTKATLALRPRAEQPRTVVGVFGSVADAAKAVSTISSEGLTPSLLEFMDGVSLRAANDLRGGGLPENAAAMLIAQSDSGGDRALSDIARIEGIFEVVGGFDIVVAEDAAEAELLLAMRRENYQALEHLGASTGRTARLVDDICVPLSRLAELVLRVEEISAHVALPISVVGHVGDGNLHPNVLFDPNSHSEVERARSAFDDIMRAGLSLGGTITGEHGVGMLKREWLEKELGPVGARVQRDLKALFDPAGILNPGKVLS